MKTILCYGDSNAWGAIPASYNPGIGLAKRYELNKRWTGVLQRCLGEDYTVIEEGLSARTTAFDEIVPGRPFKNGLAYLPFVLESHYPIDMIIFWLGTNDTKIQFHLTARDIKESMRQLIQLVQSSAYGPKETAPKVLLIAPQPIVNIPNLNPVMNENSIEHSKMLATHYQDLAKEQHCAFLNAGEHVTSSQLDGVHLEEHAGEILGNSIAKEIMKILESKKGKVF